MHGPSAEDLLAHAGSVRRIAEGLLRDPNDVDDVLQDSYVAALRNPPPHGLRAWLAAVARNAARMRLRAGRRRLAHELAAARPDRVTGTADAAARMEIHRRDAAAHLPGRPDATKSPASPPPGPHPTACGGPSRAHS